MEREASQRAVIMAAAVADWRVAAPAAAKMKKGDAGTLALTLERSPDVLAELGARRLSRGSARGSARGSDRLPLLVGFAAETGDLERKASEKLARKGCDLLVGNDVAEPGSGFGTDTNRITLFRPGSEPERLPLLAKTEAADRILDAVARLLDQPIKT
jgi:phosphopantothenoylcysteine decarboxylase/phosphopantothenate--cysteine ligase